MNRNCLIAAALLAVAGCQKENGISDNAGVKDTIHAFVSDNDATKTTATPSADGTSLDFTWAKGDEIGVVTVAESDEVWGRKSHTHTGTDGVVRQLYAPYKYVLDGEGGEKSGVFTSEDGTPDGEKYLAIYPYSAASGVSRGQWINICYTIPQAQNYVENGFDTKYAVMYALADSRDNMEFKHLSSVFNLKVKASDGYEGAKVQSIRVSAVSGSTHNFAICGLSYFQKTANGTDIRHMLGSSTENQSIDYTVPNVVLASDKATEFNIVFNPVCSGDKVSNTYTFTFQINTDRGTATAKKELTVSRGVVYSMPEIKVSLAPVDLYWFDGDKVAAKDLNSKVEGTDGFTSLAVKSNVGKITLGEDELKAIKSYIDTYGSSEGVALDLSATSYTSSTWPITFRGCTRLKSISLPMNITDGSGSVSDKLSRPFDGCKMLSEIILDDAMVRLPDEFLSGLADMTDFHITKNVRGIIWLQNKNEDRLENITVDSENKDLYAEGGVLYRIQNGENYLEYVPVSNTAALTKEGDGYVYTLPDDVNYVQQAAFHCNRNITKIVFGNNFKGITNGYVFGTNSLKVIDFSQLDHVPAVNPEATTITITPKGGEIWCASDEMVKKFTADAKWSTIATQSGWTFKVKPVDSSSSASISNMDSVNADFIWK